MAKLLYAPCRKSRPALSIVEKIFAFSHKALIAHDVSYDFR